MEKRVLCLLQMKVCINIIKVLAEDEMDLYIIGDISENAVDLK